VKKNEFKWRDISTHLLNNLINEMEKLSDEDLLELYNLQSKANEKNCWWAVYEAKEIISAFAGNILIKKRGWVKLDKI